MNINSKTNREVTYVNPLVLSHQQFSSYNEKFYPYQKLGTILIDEKLAFIYLFHPIDGLLGLSSTALGIGSYIDSLYIKQLDFDMAYDQECECRLSIADAAINNQKHEFDTLCAVTAHARGS